MVVTVKLDGLNIVCPRGKWFVYVRATGKPLLKSFEGSREDLTRRLAMPDMIAAYNSQRTRTTMVFQFDSRIMKVQSRDQAIRVLQDFVRSA